MNRWDVAKFFTRVSAEDFKRAVKAVQQSMEESCGTPMAVSIDLYNGLPHSTTGWHDGLDECLQEQRLKMIFAKVSSPDDLTDTLWNSARYVDATIRPVDKSKAPDYTFGHLEAKGLRPKQIGFYVQPEQVGAPAENASRIVHSKWSKGNGMNSNHSVSFG